MNATHTTLALLVTLSTLFSAVSCRLWAQPADLGPAKVNGVVSDDRLTEISGIVASRSQTGVLWTHNDSGHAPCIFALSDKGAVLAIFKVRGATARDWEDIALGPGPEPGRDYLYIGDIGDNRARLPSITIYRIPEPNISLPLSSAPGTTAPCDILSFTYPDGPHDAETLMIDPLSGDLYVVSKRDLFARVYRAPAPLSASGPTELHLVTLLPFGLATGGDIAADGQKLVIRSLTHAMVWQRPTNQPLWQNLQSPGRSLQLLPESQGEAICFGADGRTIYSTSEGHRPPLHIYPVRDTTKPESSSEP